MYLLFLHTFAQPSNRHHHAPSEPALKTVPLHSVSDIKRCHENNLISQAKRTKNKRLRGTRLKKGNTPVYSINTLVEGRSQSRQFLLVLHHILIIKPARDNALTTSPWLQLWGAAIGWEDPVSCPLVGWAPLSCWYLCDITKALLQSVMIEDGFPAFTFCVCLLFKLEFLFLLHKKFIWPRVNTVWSHSHMFVASSLCHYLIRVAAGCE